MLIAAVRRQRPSARKQHWRAGETGGLPAGHVVLFLVFIVVTLEMLFVRGNLSVPLGSTGWEGCLGQGSLLSLRAPRGSLLGSHLG